MDNQSHATPTGDQFKISYDLLRTRLEDRLAEQIIREPENWLTFARRLESNYPNILSLYKQLYAGQGDWLSYLNDLLYMAACMWFDRPPDLKILDETRQAHPLWFQSNEMLGGVCYVDLFAGNLDGVRKKIPYFKELGLTYLHLMPLFRVPEEESDGGYAVSSYREVHPPLGTMGELSTLASDLRRVGISLVLDLVINHTSDEHDWALRAQTGDPEYEAYYHMFYDRVMPDAYEAHLREIFPDEHPGAFTFRPDMEKWVWTTFHTYQWDLNYANPEVFTRMAREMLFLANIGVEVLRLDAVAFTWKELGTNCENLAQAHTLIQLYNAITRLVAPALLLKSEAIVHPDEVSKYIAPYECQLSYNPLLMALLWNSLATREVRLLKLSLSERFTINPACAWVNYVRVHDDIGWTFSDEDAGRLWINAYDHRQFLNAFYTGRFEGSFARGLPFQENQLTGDARISGTCASLAGLEKAVFEETEVEVELAIRRITLIHGVILTIGGIPLIYLGDEVGTLNDYSYKDDPAKTFDSRWVHRPTIDWGKMEKRLNPDTIEGRIYGRLHQMIRLRKEHPALKGGDMEVIEFENEHVLGYVRRNKDQRLILLANFSERGQMIPDGVMEDYGLYPPYTELISGLSVPKGEISLQAYQFACFSNKINVTAQPSRVGVGGGVVLGGEAPPKTTPPIHSG